MRVKYRKIEWYAGWKRGIYAELKGADFTKSLAAKTRNCVSDERRNNKQVTNKTHMESFRVVNTNVGEL